MDLKDDRLASVHTACVEGTVEAAGHESTVLPKGIQKERPSYLLNPYYAPGTMVSTGNIAVKKTGKVPFRGKGHREKRS